MASIILSNQSFRNENPITINSSDNAADSCTVYDRQGRQAESIECHRPYVIGERFTSQDQQILSCLSSPPASRELTHLALSYGGDNTIAIADIANRLNEYNIGLMGASTHVYASRIGEFGRSVKLYQEALLNYRDTTRSGTPLAKLAARHEVGRRFEQMQHHFTHELNRVNSQSRAGSRGTPLTSPTRGSNIAMSSRNTASLNLTSRIEADNLVRFTQYARFLGNGLTVIDFTSRIGHIHNSYQAGGEWERDLFIESSSFAASVLVGSGIAKVGLGILFFATPAGWVGLVVGGAAVAGVAAAGAMGTNHIAKNNAGSWYDSILSLLRIT